MLANSWATRSSIRFGTGRIEVRLEPRRTHVRIAVRDEGVGIPQPEQQRIFEKFYRLYPSSDPGSRGTGLGLYICRELVGLMGGSIGSNRAENCSTFFVELPLASASLGAVPTGRPS